MNLQLIHLLAVEFRWEKGKIQLIIHMHFQCIQKQKNTEDTPAIRERSKKLSL